MAMLKKIGTLIRDVWLIIGITLLLFGLLEGSLSLVYRLKDRLGDSGSSSAPSRVLADTYPDPSWLKTYYEEFSRSKHVRWEPYVYWRREPYRGSFIHIDADGIRRTTVTEPKARASRPPLKVFMFGGSTLWGTGARDAFTIPSILARELQDRGVAAEIKNFGESGYVNAQEVIALLLQLVKGQIPDLVIFYDGFNDTFSAYQQRIAGLPQNEFNRVKEFNLSQRSHFKKRARMVLTDVASRLATVRLLSGLFTRSTAGNEEEVVANPLGLDIPASDDGSLARKVVERYAGNIELVQALSKYYRFRYLVYWQPTIFQKKHLTEYESSHRNRAQTIERFFQQTHDALMQSRLTKKGEYPFSDLSLVFSDVKAPVYVDLMHHGESGNEIVAKRIAADVLAVTRKANAPHP
jgi:lysophospholipase L1-like esterase